MLLIIALLFVFGAIALLVLGLSWREPSAIEARMSAIRGETYAPNFGPVNQRESITVRIFGPLGEALGRKLGSMLPSAILRALERELVQAGQPVSTSGFLFAVVLVEGVMLFMGAMLAISMGGFGGQGTLVFLGCAAMGYFLPRMWLGNRVRHRQHEIVKSLPDAFDLVTTCVEAGLGLDAALAKVAEKVEGPFAEELGVMLREVSLGKLRREALKEMAERIGIPDLTIFINAVIQAETMGTSIATVLRVQADQMRVRRRQRAEAQAYKAPVKMIFPLVLCIFPTLFIVILGPAALVLYETLVKGK
ncbi:MAG TPA: type II secretion system F family protein [Dehalococcoidia bacterium]|nr:type II secretion system F family protein [Dehalococcoidia bacterium]